MPYMRNMKNNETVFVEPGEMEGWDAEAFKEFLPQADAIRGSIMQNLFDLYIQQGKAPLDAYIETLRDSLKSMEKSTIPVATPAVAVALASVAVHAREALGPKGAPVDLIAIEGALGTEGVTEYLTELDGLGLLPVPR